MPRRQKLLKECSSILDYDFSRTVSTHSGLFVCSIDIEELRMISLTSTSQLVTRKADFKKLALLFNWIHADRLAVLQEFDNNSEYIRLCT